MAHLRKQIRQAIQAALIAGNTKAGSRVFSSRTLPLERTELPALNVVVLDESSDAGASNTEPTILNRTAQFGIIAVTTLSDKIDDELDDFAEQVETVVEAASVSGFGQPMVIDTTLTGTVISIDEEQKRPIGAIRLTYAVRYQTFG